MTGQTILITGAAGYLGQAMTMALMELFGRGADDFISYKQRLQQVTKDSIQAVAQRLFNPKHLVQVMVGKKGK